MTQPTIDFSSTDTRPSEVEAVGQTRFRPVDRGGNRHGLPTWLLVAFMVGSLVWLVALTVEARRDTPAGPSAPAAAHEDGAAPFDAATLMSSLEPIAKANTPHAVDRIGGETPGKRNGAVVVEADEELVVSGWAFDGAANQPAKGVVVIVDGVRYGTSYGQPRPDISEGFKTKGLDRTGFSGTVPASALDKGRHTLAIAVIAADGVGYYESPENFQVDAN